MEKWGFTEYTFPVIFSLGPFCLEIFAPGILFHGKFWHSNCISHAWHLRKSVIILRNVLLLVCFPSRTTRLISTISHSKSSFKSTKSSAHGTILTSYSTQCKFVQIVNLKVILSSQWGNLHFCFFSYSRFEI